MKMAHRFVLMEWRETCMRQVGYYRIEFAVFFIDPCRKGDKLVEVLKIGCGWI